MFLTTVAVLTATLAAPVPLDRTDAPVVLEQKLVGEWTGGACMGTISFRADGTYSRAHYSPANAALSGTWKVTWDALPPRLVMTCEASDDRDLLGKEWDLRITRLDDEALEYKFTAKDGKKSGGITYTREKE